MKRKKEHTKKDACVHFHLHRSCVNLKEENQVERTQCKGLREYRDNIFLREEKNLCNLIFFKFFNYFIFFFRSYNCLIF